MAKSKRKSKRSRVGRPKNDPGGRWTAEALRVVRVLRDETQISLAEKVGVSPATISRWEAGSSKPPQAVAQLLAHALKVPVTAFASMAAAAREMGGRR